MESEEEMGEKEKLVIGNLGQWFQEAGCREAPEGIPKGWVDCIHLHFYRNKEKRSSGFPDTHSDLRWSLSFSIVQGFQSVL